MKESSKRNKRKRRKGIVISAKMDKTAIVQVYRTTQHSFYKRVIKKANKFKVHDENNELKEGDKVIIDETRPISKEKRWRLIEKIKNS